MAVKVINKREVLKRNYLRANLRREASMMQRMQHPHIVQLYEVMETENCYYIVMELIDGIEFVKYLSKKYYIIMRINDVLLTYYLGLLIVKIHYRLFFSLKIVQGIFVCQAKSELTLP